MEPSNPSLALRATATERQALAAAHSPQASAVPPVDEFAFGLLMNRTLGGSNKRRPSDKTANDAQIDIMLNQAQNLAKLSKQYTDTYVVKGTKELYKLLGSIYSYALQIDESPLRDHVLQRMREVLEQTHNVKTQANTPWITTVLRFILPVERQTAQQYARVLQVAFEENLTAEELPGYIKDRGGLGKISGTREEEEKSTAVKQHREKKVSMLKKILLANAYSSTSSLDVPEALILNTVPEDKKEGTFEYAICANPGGQERRIIRFVRLTEAMEAQILQKLAEEIVEDDLTSMQGKLDSLRSHLGITSGWGMEPGDPGYQPGGLPALGTTAAGKAEATAEGAEAPY